MKKLLKYFILTIVIVILSFFSVGLIHPSYSYTNTVEIDCSAEEAFDAFTDKRIAHQWQTGYMDYEIIGGEPHQPGSKFLMKFENAGQPFEFLETLKVFKENEEFSLQMETDYFNGNIQVLFEGSHPCTITIYTYNEGTSTFYCSMLYLMKSVLKERSQKNYDNLKEHIEKSLRYSLVDS